MRTEIQAKLNEIEEVDSGRPIADDIVENNKTYFGYEITTNYMDSDLEQNYTYRTNIIGYVVRKESFEENAQLIIDTAVETIINKLKELNFKLNYKDISQMNSVLKVQITGYAEFNEINKGLVL